MSPSTPHPGHSPDHPQGFVLRVSPTEEEARRCGTSLERVAKALRMQLSAMLPAADTDYSLLSLRRPATKAVRGQAEARLAVVRRARPPAEPGLVVDLARQQARVDGRDISLSQREFELLHALIESSPDPLARHALFLRVWGHLDEASIINQRIVDGTIRRLRIRLGEYAGAVRTVRGVGYRFDPLPGIHIRAATTPSSGVRRAS